MDRENIGRSVFIDKVLDILREELFVHPCTGNINGLQDAARLISEYFCDVVYDIDGDR